MVKWLCWFSANYKESVADIVRLKFEHGGRYKDFMHETREGFSFGAIDFEFNIAHSAARQRNKGYAIGFVM